MVFGVQTKPSLYRDFALLSVLIIFVLLLVSLWIVYKTYESYSADILQQLENEAIRIDRALIIEIEEASYLVESLGRQINPDAPNLQGQVLRLFEAFATNQPLKSSEFYWINANQQLIISGHGGLLEKPVDIADRDYMKRAITTPWKIHIGQPVEGRVSQQWVIPIAMGLTNAQDQFIGAVSISLNIDVLSQVISGVIKDPEIDFAITNTAFTLLTQISEQEDFFSRYFSLSRLSKLKLNEQSSGVFSSASLFHQDQIYAYYEKSLQYPYIIFVGYDPASSRANIDELLVPRLMQIAVMTLFLILTLWTVRKRIIQPVIQLTEQTNGILHSKAFTYDCSRGPVEIEQLAEAIKRLEAYLKERQRIEKELAGKNAALMKVKEAAETTNQLKANFFEQVGEALMQPARSLSEYVESMRGELFGPLSNEKYQELAESMHHESMAIMETLEDIGAISRAESGLLALNEEPVDLDFIIKKCVRLLRETQFQHVEVILDLDEAIPKIYADPLRLKQLILNLLVSAAYEVGPGEVVRIHTNRTHDNLCIEITYKPLQAGYAHEDQWSGHTGGQRAMPHGTGFLKLGHALSDLIIAMHGGEIHSRAMPDQRVKKIISLPLSRIVTD